MAMTAAEAYAARRDAVDAQSARIFGEPPQQRDRWGGRAAQRFRQDPHRPLDPNLTVIASYVQPEDVVIDVGGGAGRVGLPLALRCREVIDVDPSGGMRAEFEASQVEAGITNARFVQADWLEAQDIQGDMSIVANVTYFVRDIVPFIQKLEAASRRRVMITVWSVPHPDRNAEIFRLVYGEEQQPVPGYRELLAVLWEMGILPDVRVLLRVEDTEFTDPQTREETVERASQGMAPPWALPRLGSDFETRARTLIEAHFDELYAHTAKGFLPRRGHNAREMLITWETAPTRSQA